MRTRDELFREAQRRVAARRQRAVTRAQAARATAYALHPELPAAEDAVRQAGLKLARAAAQGGVEAADAGTEAQAALDTARRELEAAQAALDAARKAAGYPEENGGAAFAPVYACPDCKDTGILNGAACHCVQALARALRREDINQSSPLALCGFDTFELERYPDAPDPDLGVSVREYMGKVLLYCQQYADKFTPESPSLMFTGTAGLGKTHLALAIADAVLERGHDVLYASAAALVAQLGQEHFDFDSGQEWYHACAEAELLILDDLGTEYVNALTVSMLYELINTRMLCRRPTIYTSNITDPAVFEARYTEKVASRILGSCKEFRFFGEDQRRARR